MNKTSIARPLTIVMVAIVLVNFPSIFAESPSQPADAMWVDPSAITFSSNTTSVGTRFNVTVWLNMTEDIFAYQIAMHYNRTQLMCTRVGYTAGTISQYFSGHPSSTQPPIIDGSLGNGSILAGETLMSTDYIAGPHSATLIWAEFKILIAPTTGNFTSKFDISKEYPSKTLVLDPDLNLIDIVPYDANYTYIGPQPMQLSASITPASTTIYLSQIVQFMSSVVGGSPPYTYQWFLNASGISNAVSIWTFSPSAIGLCLVYLNVTDSIGAVAESNVANVTVLPPLTGTRIYVDPPEIIDLSIPPSSIISVNVTVANTTDLSACMFNLTYDPTVLNWIGFDLIPIHGEYPYAFITANASAGSVSMYLYYIVPISATPRAPLTTMRFHVNSYGISPLNLTGTEMLDSTGQPISHNEFGSLFANIIRDVAVINVVSAARWVYQNWTDIISVTVANLGNATESFSASAWYDSTIIGTAPVTALAPNTQATLQILWNTTGVIAGNYTITGTASLLPYESYFNISNNVYEDDIVEVIEKIHDVAITSVSPSSSWAYQGWPITVQVTTSNNGEFSETFSVASYYNSILIETIPSVNLMPNSSTTLTFNWNTSGMPEGNYAMSATASTVPFEYNTTNNYLEDGYVQILTQIRDIAVINVTTSRTWAYQGAKVNVTVTARNVGDLTASFNVMAFYDANLLGNISVTDLAPNMTIDNVFALNTKNLTLYHNYTISGQVSDLFDFNASNNIFTNGNLTVRLLGDLNGDGVVDIKDISIISRAYGSFGPNYLYPGSPPSSRWNPDADLNEDNTVDVKDVAVASRNFGKSYTP